MKSNKYIVLVVLMLLKTTVSVSQDKANEVSIVTHFVSAVFFEKNPTRFIADNYIYFETVNNTMYSSTDRIKILTRHLKKVRKEKGPLLDSTDFHVVAYHDYKNDKVNFSKNTKDVFILVSKNKPIMYFYLMNDKILSFDYLIKGDEGLFITY